MIGIRADANKQIALGHVMRCMTIADEIEKLGEKVVFFVADNEAEDMITQRGFEVVILGTEWNNPLEEIEKLSKEVNSRDITTMLFDSYSFNAEYYNRFSKECNNVKIACMDDLGEEVLFIFPQIVFRFSYACLCLTVKLPCRGVFHPQEVYNRS